MLSLRPYQEFIIQKTKQSFRNNFRRPLIVLPCGAGKTVCFAYMAQQAQSRGKTVWFLVHRQELMQQTVDTFTRFGIPLDSIYIGMVGTTANKLSNMPTPDLIIFDEAQHTLAKTWLKIINAYPDAFICGLTATPCRLDGKPLGDVYDCMLDGITVQELIDAGYLSQYRYFAPTVTDLSALKRKGKDYDSQQAAELLSGKAVFGDVIQHYHKYADGLQAICYCSSVQHSIDMAQAFCDAGINAVHFDGNTTKSERAQIICDYRDGFIKILCNVDLVSEGFDVPDCHCCILLRPTLSTTLFVQQSMRCMRPQSGKTAIILDHVNNYTRHGLPSDSREWSLTAKLKPRKEYGEDGKLIVTQCLNCYATYPSAPVCPYCGAARVLTVQEIKNIKEIRLEEIKQERRTAAEIAVAEKPLADLRTLQEFQTYAKQHNYKSGWAYLKWQGVLKRGGLTANEQRKQNYAGNQVSAGD